MDIVAMPTPRHSAEVARLVRQRLLGKDDESSWVPGIVVESTSEISPVFRVSLANRAGGYVIALSVIDAPLAVGSHVWVVQRAPNQFLIVAEA